LPEWRTADRGAGRRCDRRPVRRRRPAQLRRRLRPHPDGLEQQLRGRLAKVCREAGRDLPAEVAVLPAVVCGGVPGAEYPALAVGVVAGGGAGWVSAGELIAGVPSIGSLPVQWAEHRAGTAAEYVGIDLGGRHVLVAEQLLHRADVVAGFEKMRGEGVAQRVAGRRLDDAGPVAGELDCALQGRLVDVMSAPAASARVRRLASGREDGSVAKIVKLEHAWRRLDGRNDDGFQVAPFPG